jgi:hypothetical protein
MPEARDGYDWIEVESFIPDRTSGLHGKVHIRPVPGGPFPTTLRVECSKAMSRNYPVGTRFRIKAKLTDMQGTPFIYSSWQWKYEVLSQPR